MKKIVLSVIAPALVLFSTSCNNAGKGGLSAAAQKNLEAQRGIIKCFNANDFSKLGDYMVEDFTDHAGPNGDVKGLANAKAEYEKMMETIENGKSEILVELANDEYAMSWIRFTGKLKMDNMGMKAGESYDMQAVEVGKFRNGKATDHWTFSSPADMMKMMGGTNVGMPMPDMMKKDSAGTAK